MMRAHDVSEGRGGAPAVVALVVGAARVGAERMTRRISKPSRRAPPSSSTRTITGSVAPVQRARSAPIRASRMAAGEEGSVAAAVGGGEGEAEARGGKAAGSSHQAKI